MQRMLPLAIAAVIGCGPPSRPSQGGEATAEQRTDTALMDPKTIPAFSASGHVNAVIEIPAGTSDKREYDPATLSFPIDERNGVPRRIRFLPYPANYGFIPGTLMDTAQGGDGDALDVFVLCPALPSGTLLEIEPIGIIELIDDNERDDKLVALPVDRTLLTMDVDEMRELPKGVEDILTTWLTHYDPEDSARVVGVKGREAAMEAVRKWAVK
ncbi:MAG: inorganic diphosphatase [Flavobacteriales bacterium]|nr:inorganic diphosphatase [Flavobacteriales bacterium]